MKRSESPHILVMPVTEAQKTAIEEIIGIIKNVNQPKKKRKLVDMFMDLVNREVWADYYQVRSTH